VRNDISKAKHTTPGKIVSDSLYAHIELVPSLPEPRRALVSRAENITGLRAGSDYNVVKLEAGGKFLSLLHYPEFFDDPFPALESAWRVDVETGTVSFRTYRESRNPPIIHRKEALLPPDHAQVAEFAAITQAAETVGLFDDTIRIGFREAWRHLISERGYRLDGNEFVPLANDESGGAEIDLIPSGDELIARHLTALTRYTFSAPVQALIRHGLLAGDSTVFDYGCGRGDDLRGLRENGIAASGWDPHYAPEAPRVGADIVNLGFVINVIEDFGERVEALTQAYQLARRVLAVSAMLASTAGPLGRPLKDGYLTSRNTFQKYYTQAELRDFIEHILDEQAVPVGPGVFFVFRDKDSEQRFLSQRYRSRGGPSLLGWARPKPERPVRPTRRDRAAQLYEQHSAALDSLWEIWRELGREPDKSEVPEAAALEQAFGSLKRAQRFLLGQKDAAQPEAARRARIDDLLVYLALQQFQRRKPYHHLEAGLQRDLKAFFGSYANAQESARRSLFQIADIAALESACREAAERGLGWLEEGQSLQLHTSLVPQLPVLLRIYIGCATVLCGDVSTADLVKIHIRSGKVTLLRFDDFTESPLPRLVQRVKVKLREQDIDVFDYGADYPPPLLYRKSRYVNEEFPNYPEQEAFDEALDKLGLFDFSRYGPKPAEFLHKLETHRWAIDGFRLVRNRAIPDLDAPCGRYFKFRDLIECGETQARTRSQTCLSIFPRTSRGVLRANGESATIRTWPPYAVPSAPCQPSGSSRAGRLR
jgi:DNA phosphorothioation-associated putative methyltransferase